MTPEKLKERRIERNRQGLDRAGFSRQQEAFMQMRRNTRNQAVGRVGTAYLNGNKAEGQSLLNHLKLSAAEWGDHGLLEELQALLNTLPDPGEIIISDEAFSQLARKNAPEPGHVQFLRENTRIIAAIGTAVFCMLLLVFDWAK